MSTHRPKLCRICRAPDNDDLISVRLVQDNVTIARMVEELTGIQVMLDKTLPQNICLQCLERLRNAHQLRRQCIESDQLLRKELYPEVRDGIPQTSKDEAKGMVKLEIEALDDELEEDVECAETVCTEESIQQSSATTEDTESSERADLDIIVEEPEEESVDEAVTEQEDSKLAAAQELIDILAPEEATDRKLELMYLTQYDERDYEVLNKSDHYDHIKFYAASCCGCSERFEDTKDLLQHGLKEHQPDTKGFSEKDPHECPICYQQFPDMDAVRGHRNHMDTDRYHCRECGFLLDHWENLREHLEANHSITIDNEESTHNLGEAEIDETVTENHAPGLTLANFNKNQYRLIVTDKEYDLVEFTWFRCCGCENSFECREEFEAHSKEQHLPNRVEQDELQPYECSICYQRFTKKPALTLHRNKPSKRRLVCRGCEGIFRGEGSLRNHITNCHKLSAGDIETSQPMSVEHMEIDEYEMAVDEGKSDAYSIQEIEFIEDLTDDEDPTDDEEERIVDIDDNEESAHLKEGGSKYISTRQRKQMALIPGNFVRVVAEYEGYNIVEITKERCCSCLKFFDSLEELNEHTKEHQIDVKQKPSKNPIIYECEYCFKKFDFAMIFVIHKRVREQKQFYQCRLCDFVLESESRLKNHMLYNEQHAKFFNLIREDVSDRYDTVRLPGLRCCGCGSYFVDEAALMEHSNKEHPRDPHKDGLIRKIACPFCDRRYKKEADVVAHQQKQNSFVRYYCKLCKYETSSEARMLKHLYSSVHNESLPEIEVKKVEVQTPKVGSVRYCCFAECVLPFQNFTKLQEHVQKMHPTEREANEALAEAESDTNRRWQCDCCCRLFQTGTMLKQHQSRHRDQDPKSFVCMVCGEAKPSKTALTVHEMKHTGERPHACDKCDKRFTSKTILNSHMKVHFPKQHQCLECGEKFARTENLKRHFRHRHSEPTFSCSYCPRKLKTREAQNLHERSHTGEKPFQCRTEGCTKRYSSITDRRRHEMATHTGERPHKCSFCAASFVRKRQLTIHERKHTGERPFACEQCGKAFIDAPLLKKHVC